MSSRLLAVLVSLFAASSGMHGEKPFDFESTAGKLPKAVTPIQYSVRVIPNVDKLTFTGSETVTFNARSPVDRLVLNSLDLEIADAAVDTKPLPKSSVRLSNKEQLLTLDLSSPLSPGEHTLSLRFSGKINQQGQGLFYMRYQEEGSGAKKTMLGTQFESSDARRVFPCWDEPAFRARFQLTAVVPDNWLAVSNMPVENETRTNSEKEIRFAPTPPMPTYLNVFVAGELDSIETQTRGVQIRVVTSKGKSEWGRYALDASVKLLEYYNDYFGVAYPLPKLDQIALPGGSGGAMENWGGITYYESALLFDPQRSSEDTKQDIFAVIAHEIAHMWFGDLVTMAWWDNLWLNEGFASWMGTKATAHFNPEWEVWLRRNRPRNPTRRVGIAKEQAMESDARSTSHAIQQPITSEAEADSAFDDISYQKGQSIIRMLESFLGEDAFRDGIRRYIAAHKYSNSTTADLWSALAEASRKPIGEIAAGWTERPGFPVLKVRRDEGGKVSLRQERFTVNQRNALPFEWKVPLTYFVTGREPQSRLMSEKTDDLENIADDQPLKLNVNGAGYYRAQYDPRSWDLLLTSIERLSVEDRVNLASDAWALVEADRAPLSLYLGLVEKLPGTTDLAEREQIIHVIDFVNRLLVGHPDREKFQRYARSVLRPSFETLGWDTKNGEPVKANNLRANLIEILGDLNDPGIIAGCRDRFQKYLTNPSSLSPDLRHVCFAVVGRYADEPAWNKLHELGLKTTSIEEKQNCYDALARVTDPKLVSKTLQLALTDELPTSRAIFLAGKVARFGEHPEIAWQFAKSNMKALLAKADALAVNSYAPSLFTFFCDRARSDELKAYAKANLPPTSGKEVAKAIDEIEFRASFRARLVPQLNAWIESRKTSQ